MNGYFWLFLGAAALSLPVRLQLSIRAGGGIGYRIRFALAGIVIPAGRPKEEDEKALSREDAGRLLALDGRLIWRLWRRGKLQRALRTVKLDRVSLRLQLSLQDAALTALFFSALRTAAQVLVACASLPLVEGRVEMEHTGRTAQARVQCIFSARLGNLLAAALILTAAILAERAEMTKTEEEPYAAASH